MHRSKGGNMARLGVKKYSKTVSCAAAVLWHRSPFFFALIALAILWMGTPALGEAQPAEPRSELVTFPQPDVFDMVPMRDGVMVNLDHLVEPQVRSSAQICVSRVCNH